MDANDIRDKRNNIIMHGVPESGSEVRETCEATFVQGVISVLPNSIDVTELGHAHRVGKRVDRRPRPLLARFVLSAVKITILERRKECP